MQHLNNGFLLNPNIMSGIDRVAASEGGDLKSLIELSGLNPATDFVGVDFSGVDFGNIHLNGFDFSNADLSGSDLSEAILSDVIVDGANVVGVKWPHHSDRVFEESFISGVFSNARPIVYTEEGYVNAYQFEEARNYITSGIELSLSGADRGSGFFNAREVVKALDGFFAFPLGYPFLFNKTSFSFHFSGGFIPYTRVRRVTKVSYLNYFGEEPFVFDGREIMMTIGEIADITDIEFTSNLSVSRAIIFDRMREVFDYSGNA